MSQYLDRLRRGSGLISIKQLETILPDLYRDAYNRAMETINKDPIKAKSIIEGLEQEVQCLAIAKREAEINARIATARLQEIESRINVIQDRIECIKQGQLELEMPNDVRGF